MLVKELMHILSKVDPDIQVSALCRKLNNGALYPIKKVTPGKDLRSFPSKISALFQDRLIVIEIDAEDNEGEPYDRPY